MPGVYSTRFLGTYGAGRATFVVPQGKTAVVKYVTAHNGGSAAGSAALLVGGTTVWNGSVPVGQTLDTAGMGLVLDPGDSLHIDAVGSAMACTASGYLLDR